MSALRRVEDENLRSSKEKDAFRLASLAATVDIVVDDVFADSECGHGFSCMHEKCIGILLPA